MKNARFLLPVAVGLASVFLTFTAIRAYDAPEPYLPPHPYPEPGWQEFPNPGDTVRYYMNGQTVDDIRAEIMNLHGADFQNTMQTVRWEALQALDQQQTNAMWEQAFPQVKQYALLVVENLKCKLNEKITKLETEAASMAEYNIPTVGETEAIDYIRTVVLPLIENPNNPNDPTTLKGQVNAATSIDQLKTIISNTQQKIDANETAWKSVTSNVMASRIQRFKYCVQTLVTYGNDIVSAVITQMEASFTEEHAAKMSAGLSKAYPNHQVNYKKADYINK